jgi:hypothetical protein
MHPARRCEERRASLGASSLEVRVRLLLVPSLFVVMAGLAACGASQPAPVTSAPDTKAADAGAPADAGAATAPERAFAASPGEATQLISAAIDTKTDAIGKCVRDFRFRKHLAHERVAISVGIDQEGRVLGVTLPKGKKDDDLSNCVMDALKNASFPRSHAGVVTVTRTFEEVVQ